MNTQLELFPLSAVAGTGRPRPWPIATDQTDDTDTPPTQDDELPLDLDKQQEERAA
ncbi:hypothetical protein [Streptomyces sp. 5-6(2022)]|uniref:hypothetical protein n=1 Tax=Streptomyces sp. 5-6(2022) TaxID=2936510 RepID=UPI0023B90E8C|nr:hypothetical protein [Streptomyces sp. 5-6(2022)]